MLGAARSLNPRVDIRLEELIQRTLIVEPGARPDAGRLASQLGQRAAEAGPEVDIALFDWEKLARSGDSEPVAASAAVESPLAPARGLAQNEPPKPVPGQLRPDSKGRCLKNQFAINGGCWFKLEAEPSECSGSAFIYNGGCYVPAFSPVRPPTSAP